MDLIEAYARDVLGGPADEIAEHWFFRLPVPEIDAWTFSPVEGRVVPPPGAITYLFRLHRNTPVMRLDIDRERWEIQLKDDPDAEAQMFRDLDYCGHDQRAYGYPYPIKACHDRVRLSEVEVEVEVEDSAAAASSKERQEAEVMSRGGAEEADVLQLIHEGSPGSSGSPQSPKSPKTPHTAPRWSPDAIEHDNPAAVAEPPRPGVCQSLTRITSFA